MTYIDGFVVPVAAGTSREEYRAFAAKGAAICREHGALRVVEGWGDAVPDGKRTDFRRAVAAQEGETIAFSWIEWPSKQAHDEGMAKVMADPRMQPGAMDMPFDGARMIYGGFEAIVDDRDDA